MNDKQLRNEIRNAIEQGQVEKMTSLIGTDSTRLEMTTVFGSWLHLAADEGKLEIAKRLVGMGIDVNAYGGIEGGGALNLAASQGHIDVVKYLLSCGAVLDTSEPERNPLFGAIYSGHTEIAKLLIDSGIDISVKYTGQFMKDMDAMAFAREWGRTDIMELLEAANRKRNDWE